MRRLLLLSAFAAALLTAGPARADVPAGSETASGGPVSATLAWQGGDYAVGSPTLSITRAGATLVSGALDPPGTPDAKQVCNECQFLAPEQHGELNVVDLDGDGEQEILVDAYTGGAHCCTVTGIYRFDPATGTYGRIVRNWGDPGYVLVKTGTHYDFRTDDDSFAYAFASYASSLRPPKVLRYDHGTFSNVTKEHLALVRADAKATLKIIRKTSPHDELPNENRGPMAAYVADEYLLGRGSVGLRELDRQARKGTLGTRKGARAFRARLLHFLHVEGYR